MDGFLVDFEQLFDHKAIFSVSQTIFLVCNTEFHQADFCDSVNVFVRKPLRDRLQISLLILIEFKGIN